MIKRFQCNYGKREKPETNNLVRALCIPDKCQGLCDNTSLKRDIRLVSMAAFILEVTIFTLGPTRHWFSPGTTLLSGNSVHCEKDESLGRFRIQRYLDAIQLRQMIEANFFVKFKMLTPIPIGRLPNGLGFVRLELCLQTLIRPRLYDGTLLVGLNTKWFRNRDLLPLGKLPSDYSRASKASWNAFWRSSIPHQAHTTLWMFTTKKYLVARVLTTSFLNASWTMTISYVVPSRTMNISSGHIPSSSLLGKIPSQGFYHAHLHLVLEQSPFLPDQYKNVPLLDLDLKFLLHAAFSIFAAYPGSFVW